MARVASSSGRDHVLALTLALAAPIRLKSSSTLARQAVVDPTWSLAGFAGGITINTLSTILIVESLRTAYAGTWCCRL